MLQANHIRRPRALLLVLTAVLLTLPLPSAARGHGPRQITDVRTDRLGEYAIDDAGAQVLAVTTADPFGLNRRHRYQIVRWGGPEDGRPWMRMRGVGNSISVSDDGRLTALTSTANLTGRNRDGSLELFVRSNRFFRPWQLTSDRGPEAGQVTLARISGSGNRVAFLSSSDPLGSNPQRFVQLFVIGTDGRELTQLTHRTKNSSFRGVAISDAGDRVVFSYDAAGGPRMFRIFADGTALEELGEGWYPVISGNGAMIAAYCGSNLCAIPWDGGDILSLGDGIESSLTDDAQWIYYSQSDGDSFYNLEIFRQSLTDGTVEQLTFTEPPTVNLYPVVSGANTTVLFTSREGLYGSDSSRLMQMASDGSQVLPVMHLGTDWANWQPDISADGEFTAFLGGHPGTSDVYHMRADGSGPTRLTRDAFAYTPAISGDGGTVVFASWEDLTGGSCGLPEVFAIEADGTGLRQLSPAGGNCYADYAFQPDISAGGTVLYQSVRSLYVVPAGGGSPTEIVTDAYGAIKKARISEGGDWVVYHSSDDADPFALEQIYRVRSDGTDLEQITDDPDYRSIWPDLSADGSRIVYVSDADPLGPNPDHNRELFLHFANTGETRQLTDTTTGTQYEPRIDGAGESVVFLSTSPLPGHVSARPYDIYRVQVDTGQITRVTGRPDPREMPTLPGGPTRSPEYSVAHRGRVVFAATANSVMRNPDLSSELWTFEPPFEPGECGRPQPGFRSGRSSL